MAKRDKASFVGRARRAALRVEALEQRQLLAAVSESGVPVVPSASAGIPDIREAETPYVPPLPKRRGKHHGRNRGAFGGKR